MKARRGLGKQAASMMVIMASLGLALAPGGVQAEPEFAVYPLSAPDGMLLVFSGDLLHPSQADAHQGWIGYHLYRRTEGEDGFRRMTTEPVSRVGSLAELEVRLGIPIDGLAAGLGLETNQDLWDLVERNDEALGLLLILSQPFRAAMGQLLRDHDVERGKTYEYQLTRVNRGGHESEPSPPIPATFGEPPLPLIGPSDVTAVAGDNRVHLTWRSNPDDVGAFGYAVYRTEDPEGALVRLSEFTISTMSAGENDSLSVGRFVDRNAQNGWTYHYAVVSVDYAGNESPREPLLRVQPRENVAPGVPQNISAQPSELGIVFTWDPVTEGDLAGYNVYRSMDPDRDYTRVNEFILPVDPCRYDDRAVDSQGTFFYRVTAVDLSGNESAKSARALWIYENYRRPLPPQNLMSERRPAGVFLTWAPNPEPDLRGYYVFRADRHGGVLSQISPLVPREETSYLDGAPYLSPRGRYFYVVQALNQAGVKSSFSPPAIGWPTAVAGPDALDSFFGFQDIGGNSLFWRPALDKDVAGYQLYRAPEADRTNWTALNSAPIPRQQATFTDTTAGVSVPYLYCLRALNEDGREGDRSPVVSITRFAPPPLPPRDLYVTRREDALELKWSVTLEEGVSGYRIYRRRDREPAVVVSDPDLPPTVERYRDTTPRSNTRYYYSISCRGADGREGERSAEVAFHFR